RSACSRAFVRRTAGFRSPTSVRSAARLTGPRPDLRHKPPRLALPSHPHHPQGRQLPPPTPPTSRLTRGHSIATREDTNLAVDTRYRAGSSRLSCPPGVDRRKIQMLTVSAALCAARTRVG